MTKSIHSEFLPNVNFSLQGEGMVLAHERILDCTGRFYGLRRLVIDGGNKYPDMEKWLGWMPKGVDVKMSLRSTRGYIISILYRLEAEGHLSSFNK